jgi:hypothetical protein
MTERKTATVETLTAEVRVLMVGSRQVTLSVFKQLDSVDPETDDGDHFQPFGRVRSGEKIRDWDRVDKPYMTDPWLELIGRDDRTGVLVRMQITQSDWHIIAAEAKEFPNELDVYEKLTQWSELPLIVLAGLR